MIRHVRTKGFRVDRRYRMGGVHMTAGGPTICGAPAGPDDCSRKNAEATIQHAAQLAGYPAMRVHTTRKELCPTCVAVMNQKGEKHVQEQ